MTAQYQFSVGRFLCSVWFCLGSRWFIFSREIHFCILPSLVVASALHQSIQIHAFHLSFLCDWQEIYCILEMLSYRRRRIFFTHLHAYNVSMLQHFVLCCPACLWDRRESKWKEQQQQQQFTAHSKLLHCVWGWVWKKVLLLHETKQIKRKNMNCTQNKTKVINIKWEKCPSKKSERGNALSIFLPLYFIFPCVFFSFLLFAQNPSVK